MNPAIRKLLSFKISVYIRQWISIITVAHVINNDVCIFYDYRLTVETSYVLKQLNLTLSVGINVCMNSESHYGVPIHFLWEK